jgi:recombination protein RecA
MAGFSSKPSNYPFLQKLRKASKASLKPCPYLRPTTKLRDYQVIGVLHFLSLARMTLGDGVGLGKCLTKDTYLTTTNGLKKLYDFIPDNPKDDTLYPYMGDCELLTINGPVKPDAVYYCGEREGIKICTQKGYELIGLPHHPLYAPMNSTFEYRRLDSFKLEDYICINRQGLFSREYVKIALTKKNPHSKSYKLPEYLSEDLAELIGFYVSEGDCCSLNTFGITQVYSFAHNRIRELLLKVFEYKQKETNTDYNQRIKIHSTEILNLFKYLGVDMLSKSGGQVVPNSILSSPESVVASFLRGYFEGDGSADKSNGIISCSSKSKELINQIQLLLLNFGVTSRRKIKMVKVKNDRRPYHILYFCGKDIDIFYKKIGFVSSRKNDITQTICGKKRNSNLDIIPMGKPLLKQAIKDITEHLKKLPEHKGFSVKGSGWKGMVGYPLKRMIEEVIYKKKRLTYELLDSFMQAINVHNLKEVVSNYSTLEYIQNKNFYFDKIVSIEPLEDTFADFHVPGEHNFVGNGFVNHNTLQMITAYAYRLVTEPNLKLLVVTPKSAMAQWAEEFDKFCTGISTHVLSNKYGQIRRKDTSGKLQDVDEYGFVEELKDRGEKYRTLNGFEARRAQYKSVTAHVLITNYYAVKEDYVFLSENRGPVFQVGFDECFCYHTPITLADGSVELIGKIVTNRMSVEVLSYNLDTEVVESKRVINFFRNEAKNWYKVKIKRTSSVICSPSHGFYTASGKKRADELVPGEVIYGIAKKITEVQKQVILGSLLGDGSIRYPKRLLRGLGCGIIMMQSEKHLSYIRLKEKVMSHHVTSVKVQKTGWNKAPMYRVGTECSPLISDLINRLRITDRYGKKIVSKEWLNGLTPLGIAIWYCDGGSLCTKKSLSVRLSTHGFPKEQTEKIIIYFQEVWGIEFLIVPEVRRGKILYSLRANKDSSEKFLKLISDYIPEGMAYKTIYSYGKFWETYKEDDGWDRCEDVVEYSAPYSYSNKTFSKFRYNIEVEGNHNYFANNILVSNCQEFKNMKTKTWFGANEISERAKYCYGMSATIIKNKLEEAYYIYRVIVPGLFPGKIKFFAEYTVRKKMTTWRNGKKQRFNKIVGYKNLQQFKETIDPFFLIRRTRDVAQELPQLISRKLILEMSEAQEHLYRRALSGELYQELIKEKYFKYEAYINSKEDLTDKENETFDILRSKYEESLTKEGMQKNKIAALSYCQLVSNGPGWLNEEGESSKEIEFRRLFDQELSDEKTIVFTRFKSGIKRLEAILSGLGMKHVKITGDNSIDERNDARKKFQDMNQDYNVIFITQAGSAAINLQSAGVILYYDTPWSYGDLYQSIGRAQRIGSIREHILLLHMVNRKTIDEHVLSILDNKKGLINQVVGDIAQGAIDFKNNDVLFKEDESSVSALFNSVFNKVV